MAGNDLISLTINLSTAAVSVAALSKTCIFTKETPVASIAKASSVSYTSAADVATDWGSGSDVYDAASALMGQVSPPSSFRVYRRDDEVAAVKVATFSGNLVTSNSIAVTINGIALTAVPYNTSNAQTLTDLATAIQAAEGINTASSNGTNAITVTADVGAGLTISIVVTGGASQATVAVTTSNAGHTLRDDISESVIDDVDDYYFVTETSHDKFTQIEGAEGVSALTKMFFGSSNESDMKDTTVTDIAALYEAANYRRAVMIHHGTPAEFIQNAILGLVSVKSNGSVTFAHKQLTGVTADALSSNDKTNLNGKNCNYYVTISGVDLFEKGLLPNGSSIEQTWDIDYMSTIMTQYLTELLVNNDKIPMTQAGLNQVGGVMQRVVNKMVTEGVFAPYDPTTLEAPKVVIPAIGDISQSDRANGVMTGFRVFASYAASGKSIEAEINVNI